MNYKYVFKNNNLFKCRNNVFAICRESDEGTMALKMNPIRLIRQTFTLKAVMFTCVFFILCISKTGNSSDLNPTETNQKVVPFHNCFKESATQHKLDPNLLIAVAIVESSLDRTRGRHWRGRGHGGGQGQSFAARWQCIFQCKSSK